MGVLVAQHLEPVEGPEMLLRRAAARNFHRDDRTGARGDGVHPRHAGDAHRKRAMVGMHLDHRRIRRHVTEPARDLLVHAVEHFRHREREREREGEREIVNY